MKIDENNILDCGKYKGMTLEKIVEIDYKYVLWIYAKVKELKLPNHIYERLFELKEKHEDNYFTTYNVDDDRGSYEAEAWDYDLPNHCG